MARPRLIFLVTEDWAFITHRLPMARAARDAGYEVHVATRVNRHGAAITAEGFQLHPIDLHRGSINPFAFLAAVMSTRRLYRKIDPAIAHHITIQVSAIGAAASIGLPVARLNSIFGFGSAFTVRGPKAWIARTALRFMLPLLLNNRRSIATVVNPDHRDALIALGVRADRIAVLPGSGVDLTRFAPLPEPADPITFAYAGRMLEDKGVRALVEAHKQLRERGKPVELLLAGVPDPANPNSITPSELEAWSRRPGVTWLGQVADIREVWAKAHVAVLASRGEGMPMSLAEAAACGRALIASNVAGCREIAREGINGLLVPPDDPGALAVAIGRLTDDAVLRQKFGAAGRRIVEQEFSGERVGERIVALYRGFQAGVGRPASI